jgi:WD40 repeat protein
VWSPHGKSIAFTSNVKGNYDLYRKSLSGQGAEDVLLTSPLLKVPSDWSSDGRVLLYFVQDPKTGADIMGLPLRGGGMPFEVVRTSFNEGAAQFSPDAKWRWPVCGVGHTGSTLSDTPRRGGPGCARATLRRLAGWPSIPDGYAA